MTEELFIDNVSYFRINENLELIIRGLEPKEGQRFLSVCSSGDVPFALSEYGEVVAFDRNYWQIEYAKFRREAFMQSNFKKFLFRNSNANEYLRQRMELLRPERVIFFCRRAIELSPEGDFDAIYLSNIIGYSEDI